MLHSVIARLESAAVQREEDVPRGELDLDSARLSGDSDREGTFQ